MLLDYGSMIETLISSKTRIKLLLKFFLNSNTTSYLRHLESEFGDSSNSIRLELNRFEKAGMLSSELEGNKKIFRANVQHPLYDEVNSIVMKYVGLDKIVESVVKKLGAVEKVYLTGGFARGINSQVIDLVFVGDINKVFLIGLIEKAEKIISRKIRYLVYKSDAELKQLGEAILENEHLLLWQKDINSGKNTTH